MKAIIVPGVTDMNKGDQALVWESCRLVQNTNIYDEIYVLTTGDTEEEKSKLCSQSYQKGYKLVNHILKHPRRGKHNEGEHINESYFDVFRQVLNATWDYLSFSFLLSICNNLLLVKILFSKSTYETVKNFHAVSTVFVKGGGFIHAHGEKTAPYIIWYLLFYIKLGKKLNKKVVVFPNSYGPFEGVTVSSQVRTTLNKVDLLYARENISSEKLKNLLHKDIPVEYDLGFFLQKNTINVQRLMDKYQISDKRKVGLTMRPWRFPGHDNPTKLYKKYIDSLVNLSNLLTEKGYTIVLCNQSIGPNAHEDDRNAINDFLNTEGLVKQNLVWVDEDLPCDELKGLYSKFDFFVGTRFHSIIFSLTSTIPSISIGYGGNKAMGIMKDFKLENFNVQIDQVTPTHLVEMFNKLELEKDFVQTNIQQSLSKAEESRNRMIKDIKSLF